MSGSDRLKALGVIAEPLAIAYRVFEIAQEYNDNPEVQVRFTETLLQTARAIQQVGGVSPEFGLSSQITWQQAGIQPDESTAMVFEKLHKLDG